MDPNLDKYVQQPNIPSQPTGGMPPQPQQPTQPLMQTEQVSSVEQTQQFPQQPTELPQQPVQQPILIQQPAPAQPQATGNDRGSDHQGGIKSFLKVLIVLIIIIGATAGIVYAGYAFLVPKQVSNTPQNANVFAEPTQPPATPTPSGYQLNPNDTSDNALDQDTQALNQDLNNLDSAITGVEDSLNDKQTNLQ